MITLHRSSREYVRFLVRARLEGKHYDPTDDLVEFSFPTSGSQPTDWESGAWETVGRDFYALILVGPSAVALTPGDYDVYVRVTDSPEVPVHFVDKLRIT